MDQTIVLALQAPNAPEPVVRERKHHTFWTACPRCKVKGKYSIEHLNGQIVCQPCNQPFTAIQVQRPRQIEATETVAPPPLKKAKKVDNMTANVAPPPKKAKKVVKKTEILKKPSKQYIQVLLKDMIKAILKEKIKEKA